MLAKAPASPLSATGLLEYLEMTLTKLSTNKRKPLTSSHIHQWASAYYNSTEHSANPQLKGTLHFNAPWWRSCSRNTFTKVHSSRCPRVPSHKIFFRNCRSMPFKCRNFSWGAAISLHSLWFKVGCQVEKCFGAKYSLQKGKERLLCNNSADMSFAACMYKDIYPVKEIGISDPCTSKTSLSCNVASCAVNALFKSFIGSYRNVSSFSPFFHADYVVINRCGSSITGLLLKNYLILVALRQVLVRQYNGIEYNDFSRHSDMTAEHRDWRVQTAISIE